MKKELGLLILLVVLCGTVALLNHDFLSAVNLQNTARLIGMYGIFSLGLGFVIITGGIDLSVGSVLALLGVLLSMALTEWRWPAAVAVLFIVLMGVFLGTIHGLFITRVKLQPFIVTLCGLLFYRGLARFISRDETKGFGDASGFKGLQEALTGKIFGVPMPFVFLLFLAAILAVVLHRSVYGRHLLALGRNEEAARYVGIATDRITLSVYVLSGGLAGVAALFVAFYTNSVSPSSHGNFYELYGIAAAVLGGCSLRGGEGSVGGILIGTALLQVLQNLVNLLGIPSSLNFAVMGAVILIGVTLDQLLSKRRKA
ncbi:MAG: ABC transporter permease [Capsulimonadales bacterium]|nr:ABC transporter permease [Capsulimonadales bacterium]